MESAPCTTQPSRRRIETANVGGFVISGSHQQAGWRAETVLVETHWRARQARASRSEGKGAALSRLGPGRCLFRRAAS